MLLAPEHDPMGQAVSDYHAARPTHRLIVHSSLFDDDELPLPHLFRTYTDMNALERTALSLAQGRVLDIGAGAGCHSLLLQERGFDVTAIDVSPGCVSTMRARGLPKAYAADVFCDPLPAPFDTLLLLMNGLGICGGLNDLPHLFQRLALLLAPKGQILTDNCDLRAIFTDEDGTFSPPQSEEYYGEVDYRMQYGNCWGEPFNWLYVDFDTLRTYANEAGFTAECLRTDGENAYLAHLTRQH